MRRVLLAGIMVAMVFLATTFIKIPMPTGVYHAGDAFVLIVGIMLGPFLGFFTAAIGSALADISLGYMIYVPGTFMIKGIMALVCSRVKKDHPKRALGLFVLAELIMVTGYLVYDALVITGNVSAALANLPWNIAQGGLGIALAIFLYHGLGRTTLWKHLP